MKKLLSIILLCMLLFTACTPATDAPDASQANSVSETVYVYFTNFGVLEGKEVAFVRLVDIKSGQFLDSKQEEMFQFSDQAVLESFNLNNVSTPTDNDIKKMELADFKAASMLLKDNSPVIYKVEMTDGIISSARSELNFLPSLEADKVLCPNCIQWFEEGAAFDNHVCPAATTESTDPTEAAEASTATKTQQCIVCAEWFAEGDEYINHKCTGTRVRCYDCGNWYMSGKEFITHKCSATTEATSPTTPAASTVKPSSQSVQCTKCNLWFDSYSKYEKHSCSAGAVNCAGCGIWFGSKYDYEHHQCTGNLEIVQCPYCYNWYTEGNVFRNHICPKRDAANKTEEYPCGFCGLIFSNYKAFISHSCQNASNSHSVQCPNCLIIFDNYAQYGNHHCLAGGPQTCYGCGKTFATTNEYNTHKCSGNNTSVTCALCGIVFDSKAQYDNHHCLAGGPQTCYGCGKTFATTYEFDTHTCSSNSELVQCEYCYEWLEAGNMYRAHMLANHPDAN